MKSYLTAAVVAATGILASSAAETTDTLLVPERAIAVVGDAIKGRDLVAVLYSREDLHYSDPSAPRFLFFDREGRVALGIGGYVKGTMLYDFGGSTNTGSSFIPYDIPVPGDPAQRNQFYANANHSTIFLQMVGRTERFGNYQVFVQTNFSGGGIHGYDLKLKQAYMRLGYVTVGLTNSTFVDGAAGTPTIDDQGPAGEVAGKNILLQYKPQFGKHVTAAISVEMPSVAYTTGEHAKEINQRVPDIPAFVQYAWHGGDSHIRLSGLLRNLSYRDLVTQSNRFATGWAVQLSGMLTVVPQLTFFYQGAYGRGYARYVNDLAEGALDLIPDASQEGRLTTPKMSNFEVGLRANLTENLYLATAYSQAHLYGQKVLGPEAYKYGRYLSCSAFYNVVEDLVVGIEYDNGNRHNVNGESGRANSIIGMLKLTF